MKTFEIISIESLETITGGTDPAAGWERYQEFNCNDVRNTPGTQRDLGLIKGAVFGDSQREMSDGSVQQAGRELGRGVPLKEVCQNAVGRLSR